MEDTFKVVIPAELQKGADGEWRVAGLASTGTVDRQGEIIMPGGIDATPIEKGKGFFNFDHDNSPEGTIGALDSYKKSASGMYVEGRLFKNHTRAKAVYEIMSSLNKGDKGRVGMSVEGKVIERDPTNPNIIKRCLIKNVALTLNPVNQDTYVDIIKSMTSLDSNLEFESTGKVQTNQVEKSEDPTFTASQVLAVVEKALAIGAGSSAPPSERTGGDALGQSDIKDEKKRKLKKLSKSLYKSMMIELLDKLQVLYPDNSRSEIWIAIQDRLETRFPELKKEEL